MCHDNIPLHEKPTYLGSLPYLEEKKSCPQNFWNFENEYSSGVEKS